jgi:hypothetical protein
MSKDFLDKLLETTFEGDISDINGLGDINIPSEDLMLQKLRLRINENQSTKSSARRNALPHSKASIIKTLITAATIALIILISSSFLSIIFDTTKAKAVKLKILHTFIDRKDDGVSITVSDNDASPQSRKPDSGSVPSSEVPQVKSQKLTMDELIKMVKYPVLMPKYVPKDYSLKDIQLDVLPDGTNQITQSYINKENMRMSITQATNANSANSTVKAPADAKVTTINILGVDAQLITSGESSSQVIWYNNGYKYQLITHVSEDELNKIIANLQYSR